jgi:hypothetical protein
MPIGAIAGAGASIIGGILGSHAASDAAQKQANAAAQAAQVAQNNQNLSTNYQTGVARQQTGLLSPYANAGAGTVGTLASLLQPGGQLTQGYGAFTPPTGVTEQNDPGYQFRLQQGLQALQNSAAARGGLLSSGTAKAINDYAQNEASNEYGNVYNRALNTYGTNFNTYNTNQSNLYNRLAGVSQLGAQSGSSLGGLLQSGAGNIAGINNAASGQIGNAYQNQGAALASGIIGSSNAWQNALGGVANNLGGWLAGSNPSISPLFNASGYGKSANSFALPGSEDYGQTG